MITESERREARLGRRLWELGKPDVFQGVTDTAIDPGVIKRRIRAAILGNHVGQNIGHVVAFRNGSESVTLAEAYEQAYSEKLIQTNERAA